MPVEISALMIKSTPAGQRPSLEQFYLSGSTQMSRQLMEEAEAAVPMSTSQNEEGCLLSPREATSILTSWRDRHFDPKGDLTLPSTFVDYIAVMITMADDGHSMVLLLE